ncbi:TPA: LamG domain-containing protein [Candidatus Poribacteria bacterium]|nr:LamG domain-containing protein [Candidatus Poribacteria bacterium]
MNTVEIIKNNKKGNYMKTVLNKPILFFLILITLTTIFVLAGQAKVSEVDLSSAVGIWLFDEGAGNATADLSEKGNHATLVKNPKWVAGKFGKALEFNGKDTCVQTGKKLLDAREEFTIVAWIKPGKITANRVGLLGQNDSPEFGFINPTTVNLWTPANSASITYSHPAGEWHHVAAVATTKFAKVYIDGEGQEVKKDIKNHGTSNFNVNIGGCGIWDAAGNWFTGAMDEVAIFHKALNDGDIRKIMGGFASIMTAVAPKDKLTLTWGNIKQLN